MSDKATWMITHILDLVIEDINLRVSFGPCRLKKEKSRGICPSPDCRPAEQYLIDGQPLLVGEGVGFARRLIVPEMQYDRDDG